MTCDRCQSRPVCIVGAINRPENCPFNTTVRNHFLALIYLQQKPLRTDTGGGG